MKSFKYTCSTDLEDEITATCIDELALAATHSYAIEAFQTRVSRLKNSLFYS